MPFDTSPFGDSAFDTGDESVEVTDSTIDHVAAAIDRLPVQFEDKPNIIAALTAFVTPMQALENALATVIVQRSVNVATGVTLTMLGTLVGQPRNGVDDDELYRRYVRARIATNKSNGLTEAVIKVARLVIDDPAVALRWANRHNATARLYITGALATDVAEVLVLMTQKAAAAGVRLIVEWSAHPPAETFRFDSGPGFNVGHLAASRG